MRKDWGRWALIVVIAACLALLVFRYGGYSVDDEMATMSGYQMINDSVSLTVDEDKIIWINGEGMLYDSDFEAMIKNAKVRTRALKDVIVGDGITEIGYGVFANLGYLRTLKLGKNVRRIAPGSLRICAALEYLFLPAEIRDVSTEMLFRCPICRVVTDGKASDLPPIPNADESLVLTNIDSWEALKLACGGDAELPLALSRWW